jgi:hypothetical protein
MELLPLHSMDALLANLCGGLLAQGSAVPQIAIAPCCGSFGKCAGGKSNHLLGSKFNTERQKENIRLTSYLRLWA